MSIYHKVIGDGFPIVILHGWTLDHQDENEKLKIENRFLK